MQMCTSLRLLLLLGAFALGHALAQTNVGSISGKVADATGAAVPAVKVTAGNQGTGFQVETTTDETGFYSFPALMRGAYTIRAEKQGFRAFSKKDIALDAASSRQVDVALELGDVKESVDVVAEATLVQTATGDVSTVITDRQLTQIALNGRNYTQLLRLIPGTVATTLDAFGLALSTSAQTINGGRSNTSYFMVDGADNMDNGGNVNAMITPNLDGIAEVRILTASYKAEFGGRSGAVVNVVTKSGTRDFHGSAFYFIRNDALDARTFFAQRRPPLRFNNFGWTLGGPILWPGKFNSDRNKLFFFGGQEYKLNRQAGTSTGVVPTALERAGNFQGSGLAAPVDPLNRLPFPDRIVPTSRFARNGPGLLKPYPLPNFGGPGGNYVVNALNRTDTTENNIRVDYLASAKHQFMYRFTHQDWDIFNGFQGTNLGFIPGGRPRPGWTTVLSWNDTLSPTMLNYASFSVTANQIQGQPQNEILRRSNLGLNYPEIFPVNELNVGPNFGMAGFTGYNAGDRIRNLNTTFQFRDDFSLVKGSHVLKFGVQYTRSRKDQNNGGGNDNGSVNFNTSAARTTGNVVADVLLGNFQSYTEGEVDTSWFARFNQLEFYAQDSWRASKRLTVELGVRYNLVYPLTSALGNFSTFDPSRYNPARAPSIATSDGSILAPGDPWNGIALFGTGFPSAASGRILAAANSATSRLFVGLPSGGARNEYSLWGPRVGFSYDVFGNGKTALRSGFGAFFDRIRTDYLAASAQNPPFASSASVFDGNIDNPGGATRRDFPPNLSGLMLGNRTPRMYSYNLGIQHELVSGMVLDVAYVGTLGRNLDRTLNINQLRAGARLNPPASTTNVNALRPFLGYGSINLRDMGDTSNYNSLQMSVNQRFRRGLTVGANYTWSRTLGSSEGGFQDVYNGKADYGLLSFHRKHVFNANVIYSLPFFGKSTGLVRTLLSGWDLSGVVLYQSGAPFTVFAPVDSARIGATSVRASVRPGENPNLTASQRTLARWFNAEAFVPGEQMAPAQFGNTGRGIFTGPAFSQLDLALLKNFTFGDRYALQFRAESFNLPNHPSFTSLNTTVRFDTAGRPSQAFGSVNGAGPGRSLSFGMKFVF